MTPKEALGKITVLLKAAFNTQSFEDAKLSNGTVVQYTTLEPGGEIFVIDPDGNQVPAPVGDHELEDGRIVVVAEDGKIAEVKDAAAPPPPDEEMEEEKPDYAAQLATLQKENEALKTRLASLESGNAEFQKTVGGLFASFQEALTALAEEDTDKPEGKPKQTVFSSAADRKSAGFEKMAKGVEAYKKKMAERQQA